MSEFATLKEVHIEGRKMPVENKALVLDLLEWLAAKPRAYTGVMDAWRTSCPRLTIWEDSLDLGFVACERRDGSQTVVSITPAGRTFLEAKRPGVAVTRNVS